MPHTLLALLLIFPLSAHSGEDVLRIAFGSCCKQNRPAPIYEAIASYDPDVWIWMGDNIYGDSGDIQVLREKWAKQKSEPGYANLRESCEVVGTWDDHDYGKNDAGKEFPIKSESQQAFLDFLDVKPDDPRRSREGVYGSHLFGSPGKEVKVILLDTRYHRDLPGEDGDVLGREQWDWLESELVGSEAEVNLLVSSIQVVPKDHRFEKWGNFPKARARLFDLLAREDVPAVTILSGDRHLAEISVEQPPSSHPVYDITSSSMNVPIFGNEKEKNTRRIGENYEGINFGTLDIDWNSTPPILHFAIRDGDGKPVRELRNIEQVKK